MVRMVKEIIPEVDHDFQASDEEIKSFIKLFDSDGDDTLDRKEMK